MEGLWVGPVAGRGVFPVLVWPQMIGADSLVPIILFVFKRALPEIVVSWGGFLVSTAIGMLDLLDSSFLMVSLAADVWQCWFSFLVDNAKTRCLFRSSIC